MMSSALTSGFMRSCEASAALHARAGFRIVGVRERLGQKHGRWRDVLVIERRSDLL